MRVRLTYKRNASRFSYEDIVRMSGVFEIDNQHGVYISNGAGLVLYSDGNNFTTAGSPGSHTDKRFTFSKRSIGFRN